MKKLIVNISVAIFTLCLGIFSGLVFTESLSVDERIERALHKVYSQNVVRIEKQAEAARQRQEKFLENRERYIKTIKENPEYVNNPQSFEPVLKNLESNIPNYEIRPNNEPQTAEEIELQIKNDLQNVNRQCFNKRYSEERCSQFKENVVDDIENNILQ